MFFVLAASSLYEAMKDVQLHFTGYSYHIEAVSGMSLIHKNLEKRPESVLQKITWEDQYLSENEKRLEGRKVILWHDVISNSTSRHPSGKHPEPLNAVQLCTRIRDLQTRYNVAAIVYRPREGAKDISSSLESFEEYMFVLHMLNIVTSQYRKRIHYKDLHLDHYVEHHFVEIIWFSTSFLHLAKRKHACRKNAAQKRGNRKVAQINASPRFLLGIISFIFDKCYTFQVGKQVCNTHLCPNGKKYC